MSAKEFSEYARMLRPYSGVPRSAAGNNPQRKDGPFYRVLSGADTPPLDGWERRL